MGASIPISTVYDTYDDNYNYQDNYNYPEDNDYYIQDWTENNSVESNHPEETDEFTERNEINVEETPQKSEDVLINVIHKNIQSDQLVDDPDIKSRSSRQHSTGYSSKSEADQLVPFQSPNTSSSERLMSNSLMSMVIFILLLQFYRFNDA